MFNNPPSVPTRTFFLTRDTTNQAVPGGLPNNEVRIKFAMDQAFYNCEVSLNKAYLYYSWYNVTSKLGNTNFSISIPTDNLNPPTRVAYSITLPDGIYEYTDINKYLENFLHSNGFYFENSTTGEIIYPVQIFLDTIQYKISIKTYALNGTGLPNGGTGWTWAGSPLPSIAYHPMFTIPTPSNPDAAAGGNNPQYTSISRMLGIPPGSYPPNTYNTTPIYTVASTYAPQITIQNMILFNCNLANDINSGQYSHCIGQFKPEGSSGQLLTFMDQQPTWHPITDGMYPYIDVTIVDDHNQPYVIQDPIFGVVLQVRQRRS